MNPMRYHRDHTSPSSGEVFVFGSNLGGRHGKGAALAAHRSHGAVMGTGQGYMGEYPRHSYAIPTKDARLNTLSLPRVEACVKAFGEFVEHHPGLTFWVTRVGCGLAGYGDVEIAPLFASLCLNPGQVSWPEPWKPYMEKQ